MIDIHCHILNNVDDGASNISQSIHSLRLAEKAGFTDIILTPHYIQNYYENTTDSLEPLVNNLKQQVYKKNIIINLHQGNEIYICENLIELLENKTVCTLAKSKYVLFELPLKQKLYITNNIIKQLKEKGYIPVLAHP